MGYSKPALISGLHCFNLCSIAEVSLHPFSPCKVYNDVLYCSSFYILTIEFERFICEYVCSVNKLNTMSQRRRGIGQNIK